MLEVLSEQLIRREVRQLDPVELNADLSDAQWLVRDQGRNIRIRGEEWVLARRLIGSKGHNGGEQQEQVAKIHAPGC